MKFWNWFKKVTTPRTGYVKRASCGHYVLANARVTTYLEVHQTINHTGDGASFGKKEVTVTLCDKCAKEIK